MTPGRVFRLTLLVAGALAALGVALTADSPAPRDLPTDPSPVATTWVTQTVTVPPTPALLEASR